MTAQDLIGALNGTRINTKSMEIDEKTCEGLQMTEIFEDIDLIRKVKRPIDRLNLCLLFINEYSELMNHQNNSGLNWGAAGEEAKGNRAAIKTKKHIECLNKEVVNIYENNRCLFCKTDGMNNE